MTNLIQENIDQHPKYQMNTTLTIINRVMNTLPNTFSLTNPSNINPLLYLERLQSEQIPINLLWAYRYIPNGTVSLRMTLQMIQTYGKTLKITNQRVLVDLMRVITNQNSKDHIWKIVVEESQEVALKYTLSPEVIIHTSFNKVIGKLKTEAHIIIPSIIITLQPYCDQTLPFFQTYNKSFNPALQQAHSTLALMQTRKELRKIIQQKLHNNEILTHQTLSKQHLFQQLSNCRKKAYSQVVMTLKILGTQQNFIQKYSQQHFKQTELSFKIWKDRSKHEQKVTTKNVFGVKILSEQNSVQKKQMFGTHCELMLGKFELVILASLNASTNKSFEQLPGGRNSSKYEREIELVKKVCKNPNKLESINSFKNQLDFIVYIKDRTCSFISTYYWQFQKKKEQISRIMMDYYPHSLRSCLDSPQSLLSLRQKLTVLLQISHALSWLSDNQVCHRDIKPENIMLNANYVPKIVDFGSCCPTYQPNSAGPFRVTDNRLLATEHYSLRFKNAPPWLKQRNYQKNYYEQHPLFDAYSFGKVLQEVLDDLATHALGPAHPILVYLSSRCLEAVPEDRPTYEELSFVLSRILLQTRPPTPARPRTA